MLAALLATSVQTPSLFADEASTPQERAEAVRLAHELEQNPFGDEARDQRSLLFRWWQEVPDLRLRWCQPLLLDLRIEDEELKGAILIQSVLSGGAMLIEQPETARTPRRIWIAGVEGALRTYRRAVELKPGLRSEDLDELLELQRTGRLDEYVDRHAKDCD